MLIKNYLLLLTLFAALVLVGCSDQTPSNNVISKYSVFTVMRYLLIGHLVALLLYV